MSELEKTVSYLSKQLKSHRVSLFWAIAFFCLLLLVIRVREVATLLFASYGISLLLDPIVCWFEKKKSSRTSAIFIIGSILAGAFLLLLVVAVPSLIHEYQQLIIHLPDYVHHLAERLTHIQKSWFALEKPVNFSALAGEAKEYIAALSVEQVKVFAQTGLSTMLKGYSFALAIVNLFLLPFFVFYITRDLEEMHNFVGSFFAAKTRSRISKVGGEILKHVYAFFEGQLTVCAILAVLYALGLWLVGLPWAIIVGTITGLFNIIPYLGVGVGLVLVTLITLVSEPTVFQFALVYGVFVVVQTLEGSFITPKIVGESVGIHPLGVMVALMVGGELLGLLGLIIAIPAAASVRVLFSHLLEIVEDFDASEKPPINSGG